MRDNKEILQMSADLSAALTRIREAFGPASYPRFGIPECDDLRESERKLDRIARGVARGDAPMSEWNRELVAWETSWINYLDRIKEEGAPNAQESTNAHRLGSE